MPLDRFMDKALNKDVIEYLKGSKHKAWNENKLLGNQAENIIEYLINSMPNWRCMKFGIETHIKEIKDMVKKSVTPTTAKIRKMPDFIAFNEKTSEAFFIEVKSFSKPQYGTYIFNYLEDYNKYWEGTKLIIVRPNKPYFIYVDLEKIEGTMKSLIQTRNGFKAYWSLGGIEQKIKKLFPDLKDEKIEKAIGMIPQIKT